ncbi:MAG: imidazole glycerol phosphate synthase subunit HisH [Coriobacteriaceae bacterium]|nr:imidazole glycerol phosphate synthase subunit HisH [Coriobacteriaceae bacterium]MDO4890741.1 imidazole glycerol phosphate synthase subunit HisH [Coriobacteriaceae bacterium]
MIAVVDYRMGNLKSVERGLRSVGADARITSDPAQIAAADAVVLPGVGAFGDAMASMNSLGETDAMRSAIADGKPFLGICLGQHLLFSDGVEGAPEGGTVKGMGLVEGVVGRIPNRDAAGKLYKIPHVGWNSIEGLKTPLFEGIPEGEHFYFTHSFMVPDTPHTIATTEHSVRIPAAIAVSDRVFGVQFHPEKSSDAGAKLLANFVHIVETIK